jgi:hypothetical protein
VNFKHAAATLGAALIIAGSPALASAADTQSGPIHINSLQISGGDTTDGNDSTIITPGSAAISFTNEYASPATRVVFAIQTHGFVIDRFNDVGTFSPGVLIKHSFAEVQPSEEMRVAVEQATFEDGTVWNSPDFAPAPEPQTPVGVKARRQS